MFKTAKYEEAIKCLDKAIELDASYANAYFYKGIVLNMLKKYNESFIFLSIFYKIGCLLLSSCLVE